MVFSSYKKIKQLRQLERTMIVTPAVYLSDFLN